MTSRPGLGLLPSTPMGWLVVYASLGGLAWWLLRDGGDDDDENESEYPPDVSHKLPQERVVKDRWGEDIRVGKWRGRWLYEYDDEWIDLDLLPGKEAVLKQLPGHRSNRSRKVARRRRPAGK